MSTTTYVFCGEIRKISVLFGWKKQQQQQKKKKKKKNKQKNNNKKTKKKKKIKNKNIFWSLVISLVFTVTTQVIFFRNESCSV